MATIDPFAEETLAKAVPVQVQRASNTRNFLVINTSDYRGRENSRVEVSGFNGIPQSTEGDDLVPDEDCRGLNKLSFRPTVGEKSRAFGFKSSIPSEMFDPHEVLPFGHVSGFSRYQLATKFSPGVILQLSGISSKLWTSGDKELTKKIEAGLADRTFHAYDEASKFTPVSVSSSFGAVQLNGTNYVEGLLANFPPEKVPFWNNRTDESHAKRPVSKKQKEYDVFDETTEFIIHNDSDLNVAFQQAMVDKHDLKELADDPEENASTIAEIKERQASHLPKKRMLSEHGHVSRPIDLSVEQEPVAEGDDDAEASRMFLPYLKLKDPQDSNKKILNRGFRRSFMTYEWRKGAWGSPTSEWRATQIKLTVFDNATDNFLIRSVTAWRQLIEPVLNWANYTILGRVNLSSTFNVEGSLDLTKMAPSQAFKLAGKTANVVAAARTVLVDMAHELIRLGLPVTATDAQRWMKWGKARDALSANVNAESGVDGGNDVGSPVINLFEFAGDPRPIFDPKNGYVFFALTNQQFIESSLDKGAVVRDEFTLAERAALMSKTLHLTVKNSKGDRTKIKQAIEAELKKHGGVIEDSKHFDMLCDFVRSPSYPGNKLYYNIFAVQHPYAREQAMFSPAFHNVACQMTIAPAAYYGKEQAKFDAELPRLLASHLTTLPTAEKHALMRAESDAALQAMITERFGTSLKRARPADEGGDEGVEEPAEKKAKVVDPMDVEMDDDDLDALLAEDEPAKPAAKPAKSGKSSRKGGKRK